MLEIVTDLISERKIPALNELQMEALLHHLFTATPRDFGRKQRGEEGYAQEELVAELGSAFVCSRLKLATEPRDENASHMANWLEILKSDTRFIFRAAAHAQRATDYLRAFSEDDAAIEASAGGSRHLMHWLLHA